MFKFINRNKIAKVSTFAIAAMMSGCDEGSSRAPLGDTLPGTVRFIGGAAIPENEKIDLKMNAVGTGYLLGFVGHLREDGSHSGDGNANTCEVTEGDEATITGSTDVYGVRVEEEGKLSALFHPADGFFHTDTEEPCVYTRSRPGSVEFFGVAPSVQVTGQIIPTPELCATFCSARALATCEGQASSCLHETRQTCVSTCETPGTLIISSRAASVNWVQPNPDMAPLPTRPGDPMPLPASNNPHAGHFDLVLDQLYTPSEVTIGTDGQCLTVVGNGVESQPCNPDLAGQKFIVETIGRYNDEWIETEYREDPSAIRGDPVWIAGKPQRRIRQGTRCMMTSSFLEDDGSRTEITMRDCSTQADSWERFFFGRTEENRFSLIGDHSNSYSYYSSSTGYGYGVVDRLGWLEEDLFHFPSLTINGGIEKLTRELFRGVAPGLIRVGPPGGTNPVDPVNDGMQIRGALKLLGGTAVPLNEKVDLTLNASGKGRIAGSVAAETLPGVYSPGIDFPSAWDACQDDTHNAADKKIIGTQTIWGASVRNMSGQWEADFSLSPLTGNFRTNTARPCIYEPTWKRVPETAHTVVYEENPEIEVEASVLATAGLCATFCPARATADCEQTPGDSACVEAALTQCQSSCATSGARIATAESQSIAWNEDNDGQLEGDLVLSRIVLPREVRIENHTGERCLTKTPYGTNEYSQHKTALCDASLNEQLFFIEEISRSDTGKTWVRIRSGDRCLVDNHSGSGSNSAFVDSCGALLQSGQTRLFSISGNAETGIQISPWDAPSVYLSLSSSSDVYAYHIGEQPLLRFQNSSALQNWETRLRLPEAGSPTSLPTEMTSLEDLFNDASPDSIPVVQLRFGVIDPFCVAYSTYDTPPFPTSVRTLSDCEENANGTTFEVLRDETRSDGTSLVRFRSTHNGRCLSGNEGYLVACDESAATWSLRPIAPGSPQFNLEANPSSSTSRCLYHRDIASSWATLPTNACPIATDVMSALNFRFFFRKVQL